VTKRWKVYFYKDGQGVSEIQNFIDSKNSKTQQKIFAWLLLLEEHGPQIPRPYSDLLNDGIHELRIKLSGNQYRMLYFFCFKDFIILTHTFIKNTSAVPEAEIRKAMKIRTQFLTDNKTGENLYDTLS